MWLPRDLWLTRAGEFSREETGIVRNVMWRRKFVSDVRFYAYKRIRNERLECKWQGPDARAHFRVTDEPGPKVENAQNSSSWRKTTWAPGPQVVGLWLAPTEEWDVCPRTIRFRWRWCTKETPSTKCVLDFLGTSFILRSLPGNELAAATSQAQPHCKNFLIFLHISFFWF